MSEIDVTKRLGFDECKKFVDEHKNELKNFAEYFRSEVFDHVVRDDLIFDEFGEPLYVDYSCMDAVRMFLEKNGIDFKDVDPGTFWGLSEMLRLTLEIDEMVLMGFIGKDEQK